MKYAEWGAAELQTMGLRNMYADWTADREEFDEAYQQRDEMAIAERAITDAYHYQRRHRKWALEEARIKRDDASLADCHMGLYARRAEQAEADRDKLQADATFLDECVDGMIADREYFEELARKAEAERDKLAARVEELVLALEEYGTHHLSCLLAQWHEGRPTPDGGYETRYGDKWYPGGQEPECTCGFHVALRPEEEAHDE